MVATKGVNSYVTAAEATAYFSDKFGYGSWTAFVAKDDVLVSARQILDSQCQWYGEKSDSIQPLAFPRIPDADPVPQEVMDAQCEIAFAISVAGSTTTDGGDALEELKAGDVSLKFKATKTANPLVNDLTKSLLSQFGLCSGKGTRIIPIERA